MIRDARSYLAIWNDVQDLVQLGAYREGNDPKSDRAIRIAPDIEDLLKQGRSERRSLQDSFKALHQLLLTYGGPQ